MFFKGNLWRKTSGKIIEALKEIPDIKESRLVVALSGGQDSVFLLAALKELQRKFGFELLPVHINHKFLKEDQLYKKIAQNIGDKLLLQCDVLDAFPRKNKENLENWMRDERYRLLEKYRKEKQANYIVVAHHKKDLAESVLLHLFRGCSLSGLKGMEILRGKILRPMLAIGKKEIEELMKMTNLPYYNDKLNFSPRNKRSQIRFKLLPFLENNFDSQIENHLFNLSKNVLEHQRWIKEKTSEVFSSQEIRWNKNKTQAEIELKSVTKIPFFLQKEILRKVIQKINPQEEISAFATQKLTEWVNKGQKGEMNFKKTTVRIEKGKVKFTAKT